MLKAVIAILLLNAPANTLSPAIAVAGKSDIHVAGMVSSIPATKLQQFGVNNPKGIAAIVPGLHLPDYGASLTSTIYVRGLGSRMENPVIGLYIDDFPILDKNSYDLDYLDIAGIRFFHGPQGTAALSYRMVPFMAAAKPFKDTYTGTIPHGTFQVLPKLAARYSFPENWSASASVTKGYRAGGFNTQIFSDILQNRMMNGLMTDLGVYLDRPMVSAVAGNTEYQPEELWNFEAEAAATGWKRRPRMSAAATPFPATTWFPWPLAANIQNTT